MFEAFYGSFLQHPVLLWAIPLWYVGARSGKIFSPSSPSFLSPYLRLVLLGTIVDAALTSDRILGWLGIGASASQVLAISFVILGDFRVFYLVLRLHGKQPRLWRSFGLSLIVPLLQAVLIRIAPSWFSDVRHTFLAYELLCVGLLLVLGSRLKIDEADPEKVLAREVVRYALGYYVLWALSDGIILLGADGGYLLRVLPNLLYYGGFAPFVDARATALGVRRPVPNVKNSTLLWFVAVSALLLLGCERAGDVTPCADDAKSEAEASNKQADSLALKVVFVRDKTGLRRETTVSELREKIGTGERVETQDPYYGRRKAFWGWPVERVLGFGFGPGDTDGEFTFGAIDGYEVRLASKQLREDEAYLVYRDAEVGQLPPIGPRMSDPRPLYLVWKGDRHTNLVSHPRPFSINKVSLADDARVGFGPKGGFPPGSSERAGHELFIQRCVRCHALNQMGGRVGPDLNVPRNILDYRDEADVRSFIRNPRMFRYGSMPSHLDLSDRELDALIGFLKAMAHYQDDPGPRGGE